MCNFNECLILIIIPYNEDEKQQQQHRCPNNFIRSSRMYWTVNWVLRKVPNKLFNRFFFGISMTFTSANIDFINLRKFGAYSINLRPKNSRSALFYTRIRSVILHVENIKIWNSINTLSNKDPGSARSIICCCCSNRQCKCWELSSIETNFN